MDTQENDVILSVKKISKKFPGVQALNAVSLDFCRGEVHVLMGENGAGKSTLMKILAGVYEPDEGEIIYQGQSVRMENPLKAQHLGINLINQELNIAGNLTVAENVFMGNEPRRFGLVNRAEMKERAHAALLKLGSDFPVDIPAGLLSIAEQQQIEIARSIAHNGKVLIMDEPTAALSDRETDRLFELIASLKAKGMAIIYISHRLAEVSIIADTVSVLRDGRYIGTLKKPNLDNAEIVRMMVGRELSDFYKHDIATTLIPGRLEVKNLSDGKKVKPCSFTVAGGEIVALSGLVGSGRTELARLLFGADKKSTGEIYIDGKKIFINSPADAIRFGIGYVPEDRKSLGLFLEMSGHENITMNIIDKTAHLGVLSQKRNTSITNMAIERLRIRIATPRTKAVSLSGGNQQKLLLARWLEIKPKVIILDEPTRGVDVGAKSEIYKLVGEIAQQGVAVLFISSELPEVVGLAQRVLVMRNGGIVAELREKQDITQETIMAYATGIQAPQPQYVG
ncbi:sugar ABC transporter ATP-binding protein [Gracilinema caldarium]|uniref:Monosaccharide-transporting ATPase n=1 Tax=Gracilinema caldarium (strain ATCC 51460 / DSM 7334 / H1) TaxID=744872 RepID=F8EWQ9_GRAC1|nr:sugar ABC transporter ATP-binding protein [Gracilinema caldarium]AEJ18295.1 Monosaccharide-transporting ATPase [Gracilinema caldarium DSM 7334]